MVQRWAGAAMRCKLQIWHCELRARIVLPVGLVMVANILSFVATGDYCTVCASVVPAQVCQFTLVPTNTIQQTNSWVTRVAHYRTNGIK